MTEDHTRSHKDTGATLIGRRLIAVVAACAFVSSLAVYLYSFKGLTLDAMVHWVFALHCGIFLFFIPIWVIEYSSLRGRTFFWKEFNKGKPVWISPIIKILGLAAMVHFVLFLVLSHAASPEILNGQFVSMTMAKLEKC